jgi:hypothetical protein
MKKLISKSIHVALLSGTLFIANTSLAQIERVEVTNATTTTQGTVSEFGPQSIIIRSQTGTEPVRYLYNSTTNYVDENGSPIAVATVKGGLPVTIYYTKVGDTMVASKVMVRKVITTPSPSPSVETTQTTTNTIGTISEFGPERIIIKRTASSDPLPYSYSKTTTYVDETGAPVSIKTVRSGLPVTVYYTKVGDTLMATKVIVRKSVVAPAPAPVPAPVIEEKRTRTTTTTTDK